MSRRAVPALDDWRDRLLYKQARKGDREIINCKANAVTILRNDPEWCGVLAWNELAQGIVCRRPAPWCIDDAPADPDPRRPWSDTDGGRVQNWLQRKWDLGVSEETAFKAAQLVAEGNAFDPLSTWIASLEWDRIPRLDRWLSTYFGAEDTPYTRFVGRAFLVGSVARGLKPGCKMDTMLILEGAQGLFKSQGVKRLYGPEWFKETPIDLRSNDRFLSVRGCWCREWPELDGYGKADANRIKSFLSPEVDDFRAPYGRGMVSAPRRCVFVATVNPPQLGYLVDETGNRRMWPVTCGVVRPIDLDAISADREQIWAEARAAYDNHARWWPATVDEQRLCNQEQDARMVTEVWMGKIASWLTVTRAAPGAEVRIPDILSGPLDIPAERQDHAAAIRVGRCLSRLGWTVGGRDSTGDRERWYVRKVEIAEDPTPDDEERAAIVAEAEGLH